jgi:hypothetical protein
MRDKWQCFSCNRSCKISIKITTNDELPPERCSFANNGDVEKQGIPLWVKLGKCKNE